MLDYVKRTALALGILLVGVTATRAFTLADGSSGGLSRTIVNNLGEEYRMNSPVITYSYDESFLSYFGSNGVVAVNKAFDLLNAIPPASSIKTNYPPSSSAENNLWNYPIRPDRLHARAYNDRILDIKSYAMAELFSFMGLGNPEDSAFQLEFGVVALRNWDPISYGPSKYVNGSLLSWVVVGASNAVPFPIDVTKPVITLAGSSYHRNPRLAEGKYLVAPTRDDIGGYKYLYRKDNFNIEGLPPFTYQMVTNMPNVTNPAIFSIDLRWFCKESKTNTPAAFKQFVLTNQWWGSVYTNLNIPPLLTLETNVTWEMGWTTNVTPVPDQLPVDAHWPAGHAGVCHQQVPDLPTQLRLHLRQRDHQHPRAGGRVGGALPFMGGRAQGAPLECHWCGAHNHQLHHHGDERRLSARRDHHPADNQRGGVSLY